MLEFHETEKHYVVTEKIYGFQDTTIMDIKYSKDLTTKQVNFDPVEKTSQACRDWFESIIVSVS